MIVVAIIAVLAAIVIPSFTKESTRSRAKSEVHPMFAELGTREEQYKVEIGSYLAAPACPSSASNAGTDMTMAACATTAGEPWVKLRVQASESKLSCSYLVQTGDGGTAPSTDWPAWAGTAATPSTSWYFILATCPSTEYLTASWDTKIKSKDGK